MADAYWRYGDPRTAAAAAPPPPPVASASLSAPLKRPRPDYDLPGGPDVPSYYPPPREEDRLAYRAIRDTEAIAASYDRYLRNGMSPVGPRDPVRPVGGVIGSYPVDDRHVIGGRGDPPPPLPPDASSTLYVEGLPSNCSRREVAHIFRPFVGYREVRLVSKEAKNAGKDTHILCFVDFSGPGQAAIALDALQGYRLDEQDRDSPVLRIQFARNPGLRSGGGPRVRR